MHSWRRTTLRVVARREDQDWSQAIRLKSISHEAGFRKAARQLRMGSGDMYWEAVRDETYNGPGGVWCVTVGPRRFYAVVL